MALGGLYNVLASKDPFDGPAFAGDSTITRLLAVPSRLAVASLDFFARGFPAELFPAAVLADFLPLVLVAILCHRFTNTNILHATHLFYHPF